MGVCCCFTEARWCTWGIGALLLPLLSLTSHLWKPVVVANVVGLYTTTFKSTIIFIFWYCSVTSRISNIAALNSSFFSRGSFSVLFDTRSSQTSHQRRGGLLVVRADSVRTIFVSPSSTSALFPTQKGKESRKWKWRGRLRDFLLHLFKY